MSSFAAKQLAKYGWSEGMGLGKDNDGIKEALKVNFKKDNFGLGANKNQGEKYQNWWDLAYNTATKGITTTKKNGIVQISGNSEFDIEDHRPNIYKNVNLYENFVDKGTLHGQSFKQKKRGSKKGENSSSEGEEENIKVKKHKTKKSKSVESNEESSKSAKKCKKSKRKSKKGAEVVDSSESDTEVVKSKTLQELSSKSAALLEDSSSEDEAPRGNGILVDMTDAELLAMCGGRTGHKGERHGIKMSGKMARINAQLEEAMKKPQMQVTSFETVKNSSINQQWARALGDKDREKRRIREEVAQESTNKVEVAWQYQEAAMDVAEHVFAHQSSNKRREITTAVRSKRFDDSPVNTEKSSESEHSDAEPEPQVIEAPADLTEADSHKSDSSARKKKKKSKLNESDLASEVEESGLKKSKKSKKSKTSEIPIEDSKSETENRAETCTKSKKSKKNKKMHREDSLSHEEEAEKSSKKRKLEDEGEQCLSTNLVKKKKKKKSTGDLAV